MHIPDGFLAVRVWCPAWIVSAGGLWYCLKRTALSMKDRMAPLMGAASAFIFAAQMINFPIAGGTSGHLLGGVLAAVLLGPWAGAVALSVVITAQCIIFQDGGLTALGANIFNMSLLGSAGGYFIYGIIRKMINGNRGIVLGSAAASWASVVFASCACAVELALSGTVPLKAVLPAMAGIHSIIGLAEAAVTYFVVSFIIKIRPDLIYRNGV